MAGKHEEWFDAMAADVAEHKREVPVGRMASMFGFRSDQSVYNQQNGIQDLTFEQFFAYATKLATVGRAPRHLVMWVCRQAGYMCAPLPDARSGVDVGVPKALIEFSEFVQAKGTAMADGRMTAEEADQIWIEGEQAISEILGVMHGARAAVSTAPLRPETMAEAERQANGGAA